MGNEGPRVPHTPAATELSRGMKGGAEAAQAGFRPEESRTKSWWVSLDHRSERSDYFDSSSVPCANRPKWLALDPTVCPTARSMHAGPTRSRVTSDLRKILDAGYAPLEIRGQWEEAARLRWY